MSTRTDWSNAAATASPSLSGDQSNECTGCVLSAVCCTRPTLPTRPSGSPSSPFSTRFSGYELRTSESASDSRSESRRIQRRKHNLRKGEATARARETRSVHSAYYFQSATEPLPPQVTNTSRFCGRWRALQMVDLCA